MLAMIFKSSEKKNNIFGSGFNKIDSYKSKKMCKMTACLKYKTLVRLIIVDPNKQIFTEFMELKIQCNSN